MNPEIIDSIEASLSRDFKVLVLTNGMRPMMKLKDNLLRLNETYGQQMKIRI